MKKYIHVLCAALTCVVLYTSCMNSDDNNSAVVYDDMAITGFRLTSINRLVHSTTKAGKDTVIKKTLANPVPFTINQETYEIYNVDSLPYGCDTKHVLANITSKNNGQIMIKSLVGDTLSFYRSTDSIDFSKPRVLEVYTSDLKAYRSYTVEVNVRQYDNSTMQWERVTLDELPDYGDDADEWEDIMAKEELRKFIGEGTVEAYAFDYDNKIMVSKDDGATWVPDSVDGDASLLPTQSCAFVSIPFGVNDSTDYQLMVGSCEKEKIESVVWRKIAEFGYDYDPCKWVQIPSDPRNDYYLPKLEHISLLYYNGLILAIGSDKKIYQSRDKGITWKTSKAYTLPEGFDSKDFIAFSDFEYIWIYARDTGEAWRGIKIE
jgi:hypothetical protein